MYCTGPTDHLLNCPKQIQQQGGPFSIVKGTDGLAFWSDGPWNKYHYELLGNSTPQSLIHVLFILAHVLENIFFCLQNCIPQYIVGHAKNLENIEKYIEENKLPLTVTGSSYRGVGLNDVIFDARKQVKKLINRMKKVDSTTNIYL